MFPSVELADEDGLLAIGGDLRLSRLRAAYRGGIFPWPGEDRPLVWFAPPRRAILKFDELHVPRKWHQLRRSQNWQVRIDEDFESVIRACAHPHRDDGTWITPQVIAAYLRLHRAGDAHSVEVYLDGELVGGLYGVCFGAFFAGESMFYKRSGASKIAVLSLIEQLQSRGAGWLDCQMMTPLFETLGAREVPRAEFMEMLQQALNQDVRLFD